MSSLPEDVRRWPSDPFKLLGVPRNVAPLDLKRAYTRLIRAYKPEHAPEQFRRIREAYDKVRQAAEVHGAFPQGIAAQPFEREEAATSETVPPNQRSEAGQSPKRERLKSLEEQLDECWEWAIDGDEVKAYRTLERLHAQAPHDARIGVRLYWLLTLTPQVDPNRSPCDWLVAGLRRNGLNGPMRELYRRELAANPAEALNQRCSELIDALPASNGLAELVQWRWNGIAQTEQAAELIRGDLAELRERFLGCDEETWARLVFAAVDRIAFIQSQAARDLMVRCQHDLKTLEHLHLRLSAAFDRYELLLDLADKSRTVAQGGTPRHADFLDVVHRAWTTPIEELRPRLLAYLATIAGRPGQALQNFEFIQQVASPLLYQFRRALSVLEAITDPPEDGRTQGDIAELVLSFARDTPGAKYSEWRTPLLDFCLREVIMPEQVAAALAEHADFQLSAEQHLSQAATKDLPLVCVCHACRLFWA
jgi:hypothetical protein